MSVTAKKSKFSSNFAVGIEFHKNLPTYMVCILTTTIICINKFKFTSKLALLVILSNIFLT